MSFAYRTVDRCVMGSARRSPKQAATQMRRQRLLAAQREPADNYHREKAMFLSCRCWRLRVMSPSTRQSEEGN